VCRRAASNMECSSNALHADEELPPIHESQSMADGGLTLIVVRVLQFPDDAG